MEVICESLSKSITNCNVFILQWSNHNNSLEEVVTCKPLQIHQSHTFINFIFLIIFLMTELKPDSNLVSCMHGFNIQVKQLLL